MLFVLGPQYALTSLFPSVFQHPSTFANVLQVCIQFCTV